MPESLVLSRPGEGLGCIITTFISSSILAIVVVFIK